MAMNEKRSVLGIDANTGIQPITDKEFALFQALIYKEAGIYLTPVKKTLLVGRLSKRLRELNLHSFGDYYKRLISNANQAERVCMLDSICTNETRFFREPKCSVF